MFRDPAASHASGMCVDAIQPRMHASQPRPRLLPARLMSELVTAALFTAVTTSCINRKAANGDVLYDGDLASLLPETPNVFIGAAITDPACFYDIALTEHLNRGYERLVRETTIAEPLFQSHEPATTEWQRLTSQWQQLCRHFRMLFLILEGLPEAQAWCDFTQLLAMEPLLKDAGYGHWPCIRADAVLFIPGRLDRRRDRRIPIGVSVRLVRGEQSQRAMLVDLSATGLGLSGCPSLAIGTDVDVELQNGVVLRGRVVWCHGGNLGVTLSQRLDESSDVFCGLVRSRPVRQDSARALT